MPEPTDTELLADWLDRQGEASFHRLVKRYAGLVQTTAKRTSGDDSLATEAAQLTFITLARKARGLVSRGSLAGWLHTTTVMHTRNLVRLRQRNHQKLERLRTHMETDSPGYPAEEWKALQPTLDAALAALSPKDREALLLRFYRSLSISEIAANLGIASEAARKRLDRALDRLRSQLARRGCAVGGSLSAILLAGFTTDAQAAPATASVFASNAIAAGSAMAAPFTTILGITLMTKKATVVVATVVLLAGAGALVAINRSSDTSASSPANSTPLKPVAHGGAAITGPADSAKETSARQRPSAEYSELASQYSESRVNLAKHVTTNAIGLMEDVVELAEFSSSDAMVARAGGPGPAVSALFSHVENLKLSDAQQTKAFGLYQEFQQRQLNKSKGTIDLVKKNPALMMQMVLASDALALGKIDQAEFERRTASSRAVLQADIIPSVGGAHSADKPLSDETFLSGMNSVLDPDQRAVLEAALKQEAEDTLISDSSATEAHSTAPPAMELEKLDQNIRATQKLTRGLKSMVEGMGDLQDVQPAQGN